MSDMYTVVFHGSTRGKLAVVYCTLTLTLSHFIAEREIIRKHECFLDAADDQPSASASASSSARPRFHVLLMSHDLASKHIDLLSAFSWRGLVVDDALKFKHPEPLFTKLSAYALRLCSEV